MAQVPLTKAAQRWDMNDAWDTKIPLTFIPGVDHDLWYHSAAL